MVSSPVRTITGLPSCAGLARDSSTLLSSIMVSYFPIKDSGDFTEEFFEIRSEAPSIRRAAPSVGGQTEKIAKTAAGGYRQSIEEVPTGPEWGAASMSHVK